MKYHDDRIKWHIILVIASISFLLSLAVRISGMITLFEFKAYDLLTAYAAEEKTSHDIVIVKFDQKTVDAFESIGLSFPWKRDIYEPVLDHLSLAKNVFIDVIFSEPDRISRDTDLVFRDAMARAGNVYVAMPLEKQKRRLNDSDMDFIAGISVASGFPVTESFGSAILPAEDLRHGIKGAGNVTLDPDRDGIYRRTPLFSGLNNLVIPQFVVSAFVKDGRLKEENGNILMDGVSIPLKNGEFILKYLKNRSPFEEISFIDVFNSALSGSPDNPDNRFPKNYFRNKYVLVGYTLKGLYDLRPTPVSSVTPGVFIHATLVGNLLWKNFLTPVSSPVLFSISAVLSFLTVYYVMTTGSMQKNLLFLGIAFSFVILLSAWFFRRGWYIDPLFPLVSLFASFMSSAIFSYASEGRRRAFIKSTFSRYMDKKIVDHLLADPSLVSPGGTRCRCTVFFADIAGFTSISETISPEKTAMMLYKVLTTMTELIISCNGVIDKYIGDCIMAFWGAPVSGMNDEKNAVSAAVSCYAALGPINAELSSNGIPNISMRFGIHSGDVIAGNLGSERLFDYTVIGDSVNLASRLESVNKVFSTGIIISESTREKLDDSFSLRVLGDIAVKGKSKAIRIYQVIGRRNDLSREEVEKLEEYEKGAAFFYERQFGKALEVFSGILSRWPDDGPSAFFSKRCTGFINQPPSGDGWEIIKMDTK